MAILRLQEKQATLYKSEEFVPQGNYLIFDYSLPFKEDYKKFLPVISATIGGRFFRLLPAESWVFNFLGIEQPTNLTKQYNKSLDILAFEKITKEIEGYIQSFEPGFKLRTWQREYWEDILNKIKIVGAYDEGLRVDMGGGKTLANLILGSIGKLVYIAPKHLFDTQTIENELKRWRIREYFTEYLKKPFEIVYTTPESAKKLIPKNDFVVSVTDECLSVKNPEAQRSKGVKELNDSIPIKIAMTGTPISAKHGPDLRWLRVLNTGVPALEKNWIWLFGENPQYQEIPGRTEKPLTCESYRVKEIANFCKGSIRFVDTSDVLAQVPEMFEETVCLPRPMCFISILRGLLTERTRQKRRVQALTATSGFVYADNGQTIWLEKKCPAKIQWIKDFIENNLEEPIVIFSPWRAELDRLQKELAEYHPAIVHDNAKSADKFTSGETNILICSASITEGMNLQRSRIAIATGWSTNPTKRVQAIRRLYRPGQKRGVVIFNLTCENTLDQKALELLKNHTNESEALIQAWLDSALDDLLANGGKPEKVKKVKEKKPKKIKEKEIEEVKEKEEEIEEVKEKEKEIEEVKEKEEEIEEVKEKEEESKFFSFDKDLFPMGLERDLEKYTKVYLDVETSGLKGKLNLIQYSINRSEIKIIRPYKQENEQELRALLTLLMDPGVAVIGFNIGFDIVHLYLLFIEKFSIFQPFNCQVVDLWLKLVQKPPFCFYPVMGKKIIALEAIPKIYAPQLEEVILAKIKEVIPPIGKVYVKHEQVKGTKELITLVFSLIIPKKLKIIAKLFLPPERLNEIQSLEEIFHLANFKEDLRSPLISEEEKPLYENLWLKNERCLDETQEIWKYAKFDIELLWYLEDWINSQCAKYSISEIAIDATDICTHIVAYTRVHGFPIDSKQAKETYEQLLAENKSIEDKYAPINLNSTRQRVALIKSLLIDPNIPIDTTSIDKLKELKTSGFIKEEGLSIIDDLLKYKPNTQKINQLSVFQGTDRIYPNFHALGTTSGRMAGRDGINFQGVSKGDNLRELVLTSMGGDFDGLEIVIAATFFNDLKLLEILADGGDFHTMTASLILKIPKILNDLAPGSNLDSIGIDELIKIKKDDTHPYHKAVIKARNMAKGINFGILYFAGAYTIANALGISDEEAEQWMEDHFFTAYPSLKETREKFFKRFVTVDTQNWTKSSARKMAYFVENIFGFRRYICLEKELACFLWEESNASLPEVASGDLTKVTRRKGPQTPFRAISSAAYGGAIKIQQSIYRALGNFPIQSAGAELTKRLMAALWYWLKLPMMNVHDETDVPRLGTEKDESLVAQEAKRIVDSFLIAAHAIIPHLSMDFHPMRNWNEK